MPDGGWGHHVWVRGVSGGASITCGGTLIAGDWVLTAAQCVSGFTSFTVGAGSNQLSSPRVQRPVINAVSHPQFNPANYQNDIALLQLDGHVIIPGFVASIGLPRVSQTDTTFNNAHVVVTGFGSLNSSEY